MAALIVVTCLLAFAVIVAFIRKNKKKEVVAWQDLPDVAIHEIIAKNDKASRFNMMRNLVPNVSTAPLLIATTWEWGLGPNLFDESGIKYYVDHYYDEPFNEEGVTVSLVDEVIDNCIPDLQRMQYSKTSNTVYIEDVRHPLDLHSYRVMTAATAMLIHRFMPEVNPSTIRFDFENVDRGLWKDELKALFP